MNSINTNRMNRSSVQSFCLQSHQRIGVASCDVLRSLAFCTEFFPPKKINNRHITQPAHKWKPEFFFMGFPLFAHTTQIISFNCGILTATAAGIISRWFSFLFHLRWRLAEFLYAVFPNNARVLACSITHIDYNGVSLFFGWFHLYQSHARLAFAFKALFALAAAPHMCA